MARFAELGLGALVVHGERSRSRRRRIGSSCAAAKSSLVVQVSFMSPVAGPNPSTAMKYVEPRHDVEPDLAGRVELSSTRSSLAATWVRFATVVGTPRAGWYAAMTVS